MAQTVQQENIYQQRLDALKSQMSENQSVETAPTERVGALDPDFLLIALFALAMDGLDIVFEIVQITKPGGIIIDLFIYLIIGFWVYKRTGRIIQSKRERVEAAQKKVGKKIAEAQKQLAKVAKKPLKRAFLRGFVFLLGELIPFLGLIPFWTIMVIEVLKENGE